MHIHDLISFNLIWEICWLQNDEETLNQTKYFLNVAHVIKHYERNLIEKEIRIHLTDRLRGTIHLVFF